MKPKFQHVLICLLALTLLTCPALAASSFPDVDENAEYAEAVEYLKDAGIMRGDDLGNFNPNKTVTRAEMAVIVCQMLGETENLTTSDAFTDVPTTHWANKYVTRAKELGVISGYGNKKFGPNDKVKYEQAVTMVVNALNYKNEANNAGGYPDGYLAIAQSLGLLNNVDAEKGMFLARSNVAIIIYNCFRSYV